MSSNGFFATERHARTMTAAYDLTRELYLRLRDCGVWRRGNRRKVTALLKLRPFVLSRVSPTIT
jgi:hypothetical protein